MLTTEKFFASRPGAAALAALALLAFAPSASAQTQPPAQTQPTTKPAPAKQAKPGAPAPAAAPAPGAAAPAVPEPTGASVDPSTVLARVNGQEIRASDVSEAAQTLPPQVRGMPTEMLLPMVLDQLIDRKALVLEAKKEGLDKDPAVQRELASADERVLQTALLQKEVGPTLSEDSIRARFDKENAGAAGEQEVHARHILVPTEAEAKDIIAQLKKGANFADLAKKYSKDPGAAQGGDLGFFKKSDMVGPFADAAFAMKPGQVSDTPVKTDFGWHVIKVEEVRTAPPPTFEQSRDKVRQELIQEGVQKAVTQARAGITVEKTAPAAVTSPDAPPPAAPGPAMSAPGK
jgi:peptidyl-prolyl cis-trans isomerase C